MDERIEDKLAQDLRESRRILRRIQAHITQAHRNLGAEIHDMGLIAVLYHPENDLPLLNCVIPRRKTAWLPAPQIAEGLDFLRERGKTPRLSLIEGLYPPRFAESLHNIGLTLESKIDLMAHTAPDVMAANGAASPAGDTVALWEQVREGNAYRVIAGGIEPIDITTAACSDVVVYRGGTPVGIARLTCHATDANVAVAAIHREADAALTTDALYREALNCAVERGCELVFTAGSDEATRRIYRRLGFVDAGNLICYAQMDSASRESARQTGGACGVTALFIA